MSLNCPCVLLLLVVTCSWLNAAEDAADASEAGSDQDRKKG